MAKVITICNQKGGTGKTTSAISLAGCLAGAGKKTLLVDLDPQGNATSGLGIEKERVQQSIYHVLLNHLPAEETILPTQIEGLSILPSNVHLTGAEVELVNIERREFRLRESIVFIGDSYDYLLIDTPPSLGLLTVNALVACDSALIPIQCEYYALEGLSQLLNTIDLVKNNLNPGLEIEGILLTMADFRTNLTSEVITEAQGYFKEKVYRTIIPRNIKLSEAPGYGKPIILYDKDSIGAKRYFELTQEIISERKGEPYGKEGIGQGVGSPDSGETTDREGPEFNQPPDREDRFE